MEAEVKIVRIKFKYTCPHCGEHNVIVRQGSNIFPGDIYELDTCPKCNEEVELIRSDG